MYDKHKYKSTIETLLKSGLSPTTNWHQSFSSNVMLIRHDIDFSVDLALEIAAFEKDIGITTTYFFMMSSAFYNIFSLRNQKSINEIKKMGHKISLFILTLLYTKP